MAAEDRLHGAHGLVKMDPTGVGSVTAVAVAGLDKWDLDMSKDHVKVTAFGDPNQVYVDGLPDLKGSYGGWFDPVDGLGVFAVIFGTVKPYLELYPNEADLDIKWAGKGLVDGKISVDANGGVAVSGTFVGAGPWTYPTVTTLAARGARGADPPAVIEGVVAAIKWQYYTAAAINGYRVSWSKVDGWSASGIVVLADAFKMAQRPLVFSAKHKKGEWRWPIQSMTLHPDGHRWTASLGPRLP